MCRWIGPRLVWATSNFIVFACMAGTAVISFISSQGNSGVQHVIGASSAAKIASLVVFALLGVPLAVSTATLSWLVFRYSSLKLCIPSILELVST